MNIQDITDKETWDSFIALRPEANFLHAWQWGEFHLSRGKEVVRRGVYDQGALVGVYVGAIETARRGKHMAVAGGPILDWSNRSIVKAVTEDMFAQGKSHGCVFVRVRPQLEKSDSTIRLFKELGFKRSPMYLSVEHAGTLDLNKTEDEIRAGFRERLLRALRKAEKNNIEISVSSDPQSIDEFYAIELDTAKRHGFVPFSKDFLKLQFASFASTNNALLYSAKYQGELLAQNFMIFYGNEASYHYGVSTELGTKLSGAPILHMEAMREARRRGCKRYNFWGIVGEEETGHRFYGVSTFKRGFGVDELLYVPAHDLVISPLRYKATKIVEMMRRKRRSV